jgi:hypothetical protein
LFYALHKDDLDKLLDNYPDMKKSIYEEADEKKALHKKRKENAERVQPIYHRNASS